MSLVTIGIIALIIMFTMLAFGMPIGVAMGIIGALGMWYVISRRTRRDERIPPSDGKTYRTVCQDARDRRQVGPEAYLLYIKVLSGRNKRSFTLYTRGKREYQVLQRVQQPQ